ncbi:LOW QUALITY PROTEIN: uncharacterized protein C19orf73 homolog [Callospermophilus lateralis]
MDSSRAGLCPGRQASRPGRRDAAGCSSQRLETSTPVREGGLSRCDGGAAGRKGGFQKDGLWLEGGLSARRMSAPYSAPLRPPWELHQAPPALTQTIVRPAGLPWRKLMVRPAPPTQRPPTGSSCVS